MPMALGIVGSGHGSGGSGRVVRTAELVHALAIDRRQLLLDLEIVDEDEPPRLCVPGARSSDGGVEDPSLDVSGNWLAGDAPHGACRVERLPQVHLAEL